MKKTARQIYALDKFQLITATAGVVPVVLGTSTFDAATTTRAVSELGLTNVEQQR
jgi:hypothetical protein